MSLTDELIERMKKDEKFRLAVAGLVGYSEVLNRLSEHDRKFNEILSRLGEHDKKFNEIITRMNECDRKFYEILSRLNEHDRKFNEIVARLEEHDRKFYEIIERLSEHDRKFNEILARLNEHNKKFNEMMERFDEHDRKFNEIMEELSEHDKKFNEIAREIKIVHDRLDFFEKRLEVPIGSIGKRWGHDLEIILLNTFKEILEKEGIEPGKVSHFKFKDETGEYTGRKGSIVEVDVLVEDAKFYIMEMKSHAEIEHVERLLDKVPVVEKIFRRKADAVYLVAVNINQDAFELAKEQKIKVICGNVI